MTNQEAKRIEVCDKLLNIQLVLGSRAGRDSWIDKTIEEQTQELIDFNQDIRAIRDYIWDLERRDERIVKDPDYDTYLGSWFCPNCHEKVGLLQKFCDKCGQCLGSYDR